MAQREEGLSLLLHVSFLSLLWTGSFSLLSGKEGSLLHMPTCLHLIALSLATSSHLYNLHSPYIYIYVSSLLSCLYTSVSPLLEEGLTHHHCAFSPGAYSIMRAADAAPGMQT